ncbi:MAG: sodium/pantothenate symporter [Synergistaceae bacterium]|jgi:sodium/pantothenate symporter|nr:sodium/pantothenate symporter [Synergistaceae bacterium]
MRTFLVLAPVFIFLAVMLVVGFIIQQNSQKDREKDFSKDYFIGGRSLSGFVFAMTLVATYSSVSSFVGGPGVAWQRGFGWVYFAMTQVLAAFLVMGVMGKKMAVIGRKIDAVTVIDVLRVRYQSNLLANLGAVLIVVFFCATMVAQFMGGANLFAATVQGFLAEEGQLVRHAALWGFEIDYNYIAGMFLFALVVVIFTAVGGFKAVAVTDTICAVFMLLGMAVIAYAILSHGGGMSGIMAVINEQPHMLEPTAGGSLPVQIFLSQWLLTGVCTLGLPQSLVRNLSYKTSKGLQRAMIYGTVVVGAMMLGMHLLGVLSRGVIHKLPGATTDSVTPHLIVGFLPPLLAGMAIIGPLAASISTVSSLLITASSSIIKDVYQHSLEHRSVDQKKIGRLSTVVTTIIGLACILVAIKPPTVIVWVNMFAFGGLQTSFFWVFLLGFFWRKANLTGAIMAMAGGVFAYCYFMAAKIPLGGFHQIVVGIGVGLALFVIGSLVGRPNEEKVLKLFFPEHYPEGTKIEIPERI